MPKREKVSKDAQGVSNATQAVRNSVSTLEAINAKIVRKLTEPTQNTFRVRITSQHEREGYLKAVYTLDKEIKANSRKEAIAEALFEIASITPSWVVKLSAIGGANICVQLD